MEQLSPDAVDVWVAFPERLRDPALVDAYRAMLSAPERERQQTFRLAEQRHVDLVTRALVRTTLSHYLDHPPEAWVFQRSAWGRPELAPGQCKPRVTFNLSHTHGLVACAVALDREVGVDVEWLERQTLAESVAVRFFSPAEAATLRDLSGAARKERFLSYWTLKEAYLKARGWGLSLALDQVHFDLGAGDHIGVTFGDKLADDARSWQFTLRRPSPEHVLAVAVRRRPGSTLRLRLRPVVPPGASR